MSAPASSDARGEKGEKSARCDQTCLGLSGEEIKLRGSWAWLAALGSDKFALLRGL